MEKKKLPNSLNTDECSELAVLVEELTHSGQKILNNQKLKKVKSICKKSDKNVRYIYDLIIHQLEKNHSEIRFSAFQLCDEIFRRSHCFRQLVIDKLQHVLELTAETNPDLPLPLPRTAALNLKRLTLTTVRDWCNKYGSGYKKLLLGFNYLQQCKKVDFSALQLQSNAERAKEEEKERRLRAINEERVKKVKKEFSEFSLDITGTVKSLNSCLNLLLPKPEDFFISLDNEVPNNNSLSSDSVYRNEVKNSKLDSNQITEVKNNEVEGENNIESDCSDMEYDDSQEDYNVTLREFGAHNTKHTIEINLKLDEVQCLKETPENSAVIENVRDYVKLITNSYLPKVKGWLQILIKVSGNEDAMKKIMDLKISLENALEKFKRLKIDSAANNDCVSTDSEMEEVEENDVLQGSSLTKTKKELKNVKKIEDRSSWSIISKEECPEDPTTMQSTLAKFTKHNSKTNSSVSNGQESIKDQSVSITDSKLLAIKEDCSKMFASLQNIETKPSTSTMSDDCKPSTSKGYDGGEINERKKKLLTVAPKLPFDVDLYHWEDDNLKAPTLLPTSMDTTKFWSSVSGDDILEVTVPEGSSSLRTRVIEFVGEFEPVTRSCSAPLANGKLCPRRDRYKCPFHGIIVPRDEMGKCVNLEDELKIKAAADEKKVPDWQDPELLKDIEKATGVNLKMPEKGKKKKKEKKYPGLTDIDAKKNTAKNRLSKKVFRRSSMKRVAQALDNMDRRRFRDKYGDQFHYMYDTA